MSSWRKIFLLVAFFWLCMLPLYLKPMCQCHWFLNKAWELLFFSGSLCCLCSVYSIFFSYLNALFLQYWDYPNVYDVPLYEASVDICRFTVYHLSFKATITWFCYTPIMERFLKNHLHVLPRYKIRHSHLIWGSAVPWEELLSRPLNPTSQSP